MNSKNDLRLLVDTIKDPRDMAELVHLVLATNQNVEVTGNSITHSHPKVAGQVNSWKPGFRQSPTMTHVHYSQSYLDKVRQLKAEGYIIVGTSPNHGSSIFETDLSKGRHVLVFGTEVGGLSREKMAVVDKMVKVPMLNETRFYTLRVIIPIIVHEVLRQKGFFGRPRINRELFHFFL